MSVEEAHLRMIMFHFCVDLFIHICRKVLIKLKTVIIDPKDVDSLTIIGLPRNKSLLLNTSLLRTLYPVPFHLFTFYNDT